MPDPQLVAGQFAFRVDTPPSPRGGSFFGPAATFTLFPDAIMHIVFTGQVSLPPGKWEVGIVQNVWNDRVTIVYSLGGEFYFSHDTKPLLDVVRGATDIWLDTLGNGVKTFDNPGSRLQTFSVMLDAGDVATSPPIPGRRLRCGNAIDELRVFAERALQLVGAIVIREVHPGGRKGALFPVAATGDTYGFIWRLEPAPGTPNFRFRPLIPRRVERPPFSLLRPHGLGTDLRQTANEYGDQLAAQAEARYKADCKKGTPRTGDDNLWDLWQPSTP